MLPSITLTGEGGYASAALRTLLRPESAFFNIAAGLVQPMLDGWRLQGQLDLTAGPAGRIAAALSQGGGQRLRRRRAGADRGAANGRREQLQREVVRSSRRAFEISETRLREGAVDLVTVLNTQQALFQAEDTLAQARLARLQAVVSLFQALGGGWPLPPKRIAAPTPS